MRKWEKLPSYMQNDDVKYYYDILKKKKLSRFLKRAFDLVVSLFMLILLSPIFLILAIAIKIDSKGPVFYRQVRVTRYGETFKIFKFRTMVSDADKKGGQISTANDSRITRVGKVIRKLRIDELSQLIDVFRGKMSFVGTRPEVPFFVNQYTPKMYATLLMPAGITSLASIKFKDEDKMLIGSTKEEIDKIYVEKVLPLKMEYNLNSIEKFGFFNEIGIMFKTVFAVFKKD